MTDDQRVLDSTGVANLWCQIILEAIDSVKGKPPCEFSYTAIQREKELARQWFVSNSKAPCTFLWVCDQLDLDSDPIRDFALNGTTRNTDSELITLAKRLKAFRWRHKIKQFEFAKLAGLCPATICAIEKGRHNKLDRNGARARVTRILENSFANLD